MKWRVILKIRYVDIYFDFDNLEDAGAFVTTALTHYNGDDDGKDAKLFATIECFTKQNEQEEEE